VITTRASRTDVFRALADPTRRSILDLLRRGELPVGSIAERFDTTRPAVSKHLRILRGALLVRERREGRLRICELNSEPLKQVDAWLDEYRRFWSVSLRRLKRHMEGGRA